jgi:hypothetical protein
MRDPNRIERIGNKLIEYWKRNPDQRLGQLVMNIELIITKGKSHDPFYREDDEIEQFLDRQLG